MSELELLKSNHDGKTYQADGFKLLYRNKGSVSGDNEENFAETMYLVCGTVSITLKDTAKEFITPAVFSIPAKTYHKVEAITDITIVMFELGEES